MLPLVVLAFVLIGCSDDDNSDYGELDAFASSDTSNDHKGDVVGEEVRPTSEMVEELIQHYETITHDTPPTDSGILTHDIADAPSHHDTPPVSEDGTHAETIPCDTDGSDDINLDDTLADQTSTLLKLGATSIAPAIDACKLADNSAFYTIVAFEGIAPSIFIDPAPGVGTYTFDNVISEEGSASWTLNKTAGDPVKWIIEGLPERYFMNEFLCWYDSDTAGSEIVLCSLKLMYHPDTDPEGICAIVYESLKEAE